MTRLFCNQIVPNIIEILLSNNSEHRLKYMQQHWKLRYFNYVAVINNVKFVIKEEIDLIQ